MGRLIDADEYEKRIKLYDTEDIMDKALYNFAHTKLISTPTARPKGKWIIKDNPGTGWYRIICSECGEDVTSTAPCIGFFPNAKVIWDFCPYCGSDNREVE